MHSLLVTGPSKFSPTTQLILNEAKKEFNVSYIPLYDINIIIDNNEIKCEYMKKDLTKFDYLLPRIDAPRKEYGYQIMKAFDTTDIRKPYNADVINIAHDKFLTNTILAIHKIKVPKTYLLRTGSGMLYLLEEMQFPVMLKLRSGSGGKGVMFVEDKETMKSILKSMEILKQEVLVQNFIENPGEDIRVIVLGDEICAAYKRIAKTGEKRANIKIGGSAERYTPTEEINEIAIKAAKAVKSDILAVDIIESKTEGPHILEVNINPGIKGMMEATDINIAKRIIDYIKMQVKK